MSWSKLIRSSSAIVALCIVAATALSGQSARAATLTWTGGAGATWSTASTLWSGATVATPWDSTNGTADIANFNTAGATPVVSGVVNVNGITFASTANISGGTINLLAGTLATPAMTLNASGTISSALAGNVGLTATGGSTLTLAGNNTYTGVTTVGGASNPTVNVTGNESSATGGWAILTSGGNNTPTVNFQSGSIVAVAAGNSIVVGNTADGSSSHPKLTISGTVNDSGNFAQYRKAEVDVNSGGVLNISGSLSVNANGGYPSNNMNVNSGGLLNYTGTSAIAINSGSSGGNVYLIVNGGTLQTTQGLTGASGGGGSYAFQLENNGVLQIASSTISNLTAGSVQFQLPAGTGTINTGTNSTSISYGITGAGGLNLTGGGLLALTGSNVYTGGTTISGGTLQIGNGGNSGALATAAGNAITDKATLAFSRSDNISQGTNFSTASITGTGGLVQLGPGTLTLNAANTYGGGTTIAGGTLSAATIASGASNLGNATTAIALGGASTPATLLYTGNSAAFAPGLAINPGGGILTVSTAGQTLTLGSVSTATTGALTVGGAGNTTVQAALPSGINSLTKTGTGSLLLAGGGSNSGPTTISGGGLYLNGANATLTISVTGGAALGGSGTAASATANMANGGILDFSQNAGATFDINSVNFQNQATINVGNLTSFASVPALNVTGNNGLTAQGSQNSVTISLYGSAPTTGGTADLVQYNGSIQGSGSSAFSYSVANMTGVSNRDHFSVINPPGYIAVQYTVDYPIWTGALNGIWDTNSQGAPENWVLASNPSQSTYFEYNDSPLFNDSAGSNHTVVSISGTGGNVHPSLVTFGNTTTSYTLTSTTGNGIVGAASMLINGGGAVTIANSNAYTGGTNLVNGTLNAAVASALGSGTVAVSGGIYNANAAQSTAGLNVTGGVVNDGAANSLGTGPLAISEGTVTANNSQSLLSVTLSGGLLNVAGSGAVGNGPITVNGGVLNDLAANSLGTGALAISGGTVNANNPQSVASVTLSGGLLNFAGPNALSGVGITLSGGSLDNTSGSAMTLANNKPQTWTNGFTFVGSSPLNMGTAAVTMNVPTTVYVNSNVLTVGGAITGSGALTKNGGGTLVLAVSNGYSGGTILQNGTLALGSSGAIGPGTLTINGGALDNSSGSAMTLANNNAQNWSGDFTFIGTQSLNLGTGAVTLGSNRTVTVDANTLTVGGVISDGGGGYGLTLAGNGQLALTAKNTFSGNVTVNGGTLNANYSNNTGSPTYSSLGNPQTAGRTVTVNNGGTLLFSQGNSLGNGSTTPQLGLVINAGGQVTSLAALGNNNVLGNVTLNGGTLTTGSGNSGAYESYEFGGTVTVGGSSASTIAAGGTSYNGINLGINQSAGYQTTFNVGLTAAGGTASSNPDLTVSAPLADSGASYNATGLIMNGAGMMQITSACTYTGTTTISSGTLQLGNGGNSGSLSTSTSSLIVNNGTLAFSRSDNIAQGTQFSGGAITGTGGLVQSGPGTVVLSANNTYTGATNVNGGVLSVTGVLASNSVNVANGATLTGASGVVAGTVSIAGGGAIDFTKDGLAPGSSTTLQLGGLTVGDNSASPASLTFNVNINGQSADLINLGSGTLTANASGATVNVAPASLVAGTYNLITYGSTTGSGSITLNPADAQIRLYNLALVSTPNALELNVTGTPVPALAYWSGNYNAQGGTANANWGGCNLTGPVTNWSLDPGGTVDAGQIVGAASDVVFAATSAPGNVNSTLDGPYIINSLTVTTTGAVVISGSGQNLTIEALASGTNSLGNSLNYAAGTGIVMQPGAGPLSIGANTVIAAASQSWTNNSSSLLTISSNIAGTATAGNTTVLTLAGTGSGASLGGNISDGISGGSLALVANMPNGAITLAGNNSYSGGTTLSGGLLQLGNSAALGTGALAANGGTLNLAGYSVTVPSFSGASGVVTNNAAATLATLTVNQAGTTSFNGTLQNGAGTLALTQQGFGTLWLTGANAYTGVTTVSNGTVYVTGNESSATGGWTMVPSGANAISVNFQAGSNVVVAPGGSITVSSAGANGGSSTNLNIAGTVTDNGAFSVWRIGQANLNSGAVVNIPGSLSVTGVGGYGCSMAVNAGALLNYTGTGAIAIYGGTNNAGSGYLVINGGTLQSTMGLSGSNGGGGAVDQFQLENNGVLVIASNTIANLTPVVAGSGAQFVLPSGTGIINTGTNSTSISYGISGGGGLTLTGGGLLALTGSCIYTGATNISGGILQIGGGGSTGSLAAASAITDNATLAFSRSDTGLSVSNSISGSGSVIQAGSGLTLLSGGNSYTGGTTISAGTLQLGNAGALGTGALAANGGVLDLDGFSVTVSSFSGAAGVVTNSGSATVATLTTNQSGATTFRGSLRNGARQTALSMNGSGMLTLAGINTYSGPTTVYSGTLLAAASNSLSPNSAVTVDDGGVLDATAAPQTVASYAGNRIRKGDVNKS